VEEVKVAVQAATVFCLWLPF